MNPMHSAILFGCKNMDYEAELVWLMLHPWDLHSFWHGGHGFFAVMPGGKGCCCPVMVKIAATHGQQYASGVRHWLDDNIALDPLIPTDMEQFQRVFVAMTPKLRERVLERFIHYQRKARESCDDSFSSASSARSSPAGSLATP